MYYVIPAKAANAALAKKFIDFAESPEVQAEGIVKQFNWYPGIDPQYVQAKLDAGGVEQALHRHHAGRPREERPAVPAVRLLHRHRRRLRARRAEVARPASGPVRPRSGPALTLLWPPTRRLPWTRSIAAGAGWDSRWSRRRS